MKILLFDLYNMIHRARHSFIKGENATIFNFFRSFKTEIVRHSPDRVYVVSEGRPLKRLALNPEYKGTRVRNVDEDFSRQKKEIMNLVKLLPVTFARHEHVECDDVIGFLASKVYRGSEVIICSTDTDFIQLLEHDNIALWNPIKKKFAERWPVDYVMYKSLKGDSTDNVSGVRGIGDKRAMKLVSDPKTMVDLFESSPKAKEQYENSYEQIKFIDITSDDPRLKMEVCNLNLESLKEAFCDFNFKSIVGKSWIKWQETMESLNESRANQKSF